ncbi:hypothetical protein Tco_0388815 [Tanacetum coccineum]
MILTGMLGHISNGTPFLMYPRFVQLFLNKQLEGVDRPQDFIPSVSLPSKVFTFMRKHSTKFSCRITPLTPSMLEVVTALAAEEEHSPSPSSRAASSARDAQGSPTQSAAHSQRTASVQGTASFHSTANSQGTAEIQGTDDFQGTAEPHDAASIPKSPNDYTPTDASQTSGGDEGLLDVYALNREVKRLKRQTLSQAKLIRKLKTKLKHLSQVVAPLVKHHALWVENQNLKKQKRRRKKHKKKVCCVTPDGKKSDGDMKKLILRRERKLLCPSSHFRPIQVMDSEEQRNAAEVLVSISRPRGLSIPGPIQTQPQQPTQALEYNDEEVAMKNSCLGNKWDAEEERIFITYIELWDDYYELIPSTGIRFDALVIYNHYWESAESMMMTSDGSRRMGNHKMEISLSRELMIWMLETGMDVEDESETAHYFEHRHLMDKCKCVSHIVDLDLFKLSIVLQRLVRSYTKDLHLPIPSPVSSPPVLLPSTNRRADRPEVCLPPRKRLCFTQGPRYEVGKSSSAAAARPTGGRMIDYGFVGTMDAEIRRWIAQEVDYGIRDA